MMERADFSLMASDDEKAAAARLALTVREVEKHLSLPEKEAASAAAGAAAMIRRSSQCGGGARRDAQRRAQIGKVGGT